LRFQGVTISQGPITSNIFISYRREDSAAYAGRVSDQLGEILGPNRVFMDVENISPGQNFAQAIDQTIDGCQTMLVIVGPRWKAILLDRISNEHEDYVRHEIESALTRKVKVIPVIVGGAASGELSGLPPALAELSFHQAFEIRDDSFREDCDRLAQSLGLIPVRRWRRAAILSGAAIAVLLFALLSMYGINSWRRQRQAGSAVMQLVTTSQTQIKLGEYEAAYRSGKQAAKLDPANSAVLNQQADAAMSWLEHYSVAGGENVNIEEIAAGQLAELMGVLDGAFSRTNEKGPRAADILAHIGWAHWLNQHIAEKEFGSAAEDSFRRAIAIEPTNVYANSMLGNWLLQNNKDFDEAVKCFAIALATGRERALVRSLQLGGLLYNDAAGAPVEAIKVLNDMRKSGEYLADGYRARFLSTDFNPVYSDEFMNSVLTAVPPDEDWKTYLWLDTGTSTSDPVGRQLKRDFIWARLLELQGKKPEAIAAYTALKAKLASAQMDGRIAAHVADALTRLTTLSGRSTFCVSFLS